jgi:hypothetical protein
MPTSRATMSRSSLHLDKALIERLGYQARTNMFGSIEAARMLVQSGVMVPRCGIISTASTNCSGDLLRRRDLAQGQ